MATEEERIQATVDRVIRQYQTTPIQYFPYATGATDVYKQRSRTYGTAITLVGRAILSPTPEQLTVIGNNESYDVAFLFSRTEMRLKFPGIDDGEWVDVDGEMTWFNRRYKIEKVAPTGQVGSSFSLVVIMARTIQSQRD